VRRHCWKQKHLPERPDYDSSNHASRRGDQSERAEPDREQEAPDDQRASIRPLRRGADNRNFEPDDQQRVDREQHPIERWRQVQVLDEIKRQGRLVLKEHDADQDYTA